MSCEFDLDYQAIAAKERHATLLAESLLHQQLKQILGSQGQKHSAWQWFRQTILHRHAHVQEQPTRSGILCYSKPL